MSSKAHIFYNYSIEFYNETNEEVHTFGTFRGYNVHCLFRAECIKNFKLDNDFLFITFNPNDKDVIEFGVNKLKFWLNNVQEIEFDGECLCVVYKGSAYDWKELDAKNFQKFTF